MDILTPKRIGSGLAITMAMNIGMILTEPTPHTWTIGSFDFKPDPKNPDGLYAEVTFNTPISRSQAEAATESEIMAFQSDLGTQGFSSGNMVESATCHVTATRQHAADFILRCSLDFDASLHA